MCFDAKTSLTTFIGGTVVSLGVMTWALFYKKTSLALLAGGWVWVIFMQWWEYMVWKNWQPEMATKMAYVFNIMQIPILYFLFILWSPSSLSIKALATSIVCLYLCIMFYTDAAIDITKNEQGHLTYSWWANRLKCGIYFFALASVFILLVRPIYWSVACVFTLFILLGLSMILYGNKSTPSLWCFFAVFFPILACIYTFLLT